MTYAFIPRHVLIIGSQKKSNEQPDHWKLTMINWRSHRNFIVFFLFFGLVLLKNIKKRNNTECDNNPSIIISHKYNDDCMLLLHLSVVDSGGLCLLWNDDADSI